MFDFSPKTRARNSAAKIKWSPSTHIVYLLPVYTYVQAVPLVQITVLRRLHEPHHDSHTLVPVAVMLFVLRTYNRNFHIKLGRPHNSDVRSSMHIISRRQLGQRRHRTVFTPNKGHTNRTSPTYRWPSSNALALGGGTGSALVRSATARVLRSYRGSPAAFEKVLSSVEQHPLDVFPRGTPKLRAVR